MNLAGTLPKAFVTDRYLIRRYQPEDENVLFKAARASITEVFPFLPWCHPDYTRDDARAWLGRVKNNWKEGSAYNFGIFSHDETEFYGGCGINRIDEHPIGNLGYWISSNSTGRGIATEATINLADFAINKLGLQRVEIIMSTENEGSRRVAERSGASLEGTLRNRLLLHDRRHDAYVYSIIPADLGS